MSHSSPSVLRRGFTLLELLVVLAILGVLVGLLLPAVQKVREAAAALTCKNNLRQIGLATIQFSEVYEAYPPARVVERPPRFDEPGNLPGPSCGGEHVSWLVRILPYIEQENLYRSWVYSSPFSAQPESARMTVVPSFICPTRRSLSQARIPSQAGTLVQLPCGCQFRSEPIIGGAVTDYAGNHGDLSPGSGGLPTDLYWGGYGTGVLISSRPVCQNDQPTMEWLDRIRPSDLLDGHSNTILIGERHVVRNRLGIAPSDGSGFDGSRFFNMSRVAGPGVPIAQNPEDEVEGMHVYAFGSWHKGTCHFIFADGRVTALRNDVNTEVLERLCHRSDGFEIPDY